MSNKNARKHHYLISAEITFVPPGAPEGTMNTIKQNGILLTNAKQITERDLGRAQQVVQLNLHNAINSETPVQMLDVQLLNLVYLGHMSEPEFRAVPPGLKLVPKADNDEAPPLPLDPEVKLDLPVEDAIKAAEVQNERA